MSSQPERDDSYERLIHSVNRANLHSLEDTLYYCSKEWPRCKPSLDMMIRIRDKLQMAAAEIFKCL